MKKLLVIMAFILSMMFLASCQNDMGPKPTFLGMRNGTLNDFENAKELSVSSNKLLSYQLLSEENPNFIGDVRVVKRFEEVVLLFDIEQPEDETYIRTNFAVRLYSNYDFTDGTEMPEGKYDYEWFTKDYEGIGKLYLLKTNTENLDTLVIKIPIMANFPNTLEIGVEAIRYNGRNGTPVDYDSTAIKALNFVVSLDDTPQYEVFLEMSQYNTISKILKLFIGQDMIDEPDIILLNENTLYDVVINDTLIEVDADLYSRMYLEGDIYFVNVDLNDYEFTFIQNISLNFTYLIFNNQEYDGSLDFQFEIES